MMECLLPVWDLVGLGWTSWDVMGRDGTWWDLVGLLGTSWDFLGLLGTSWDFLGLLGTWVGHSSSVKYGLFYNRREDSMVYKKWILYFTVLQYELPRTPNETLVSETHTQITRHKAAHHGVLVHCCPCDITIPHRTTPFSRGDNTLQRKATAALDWYRCTI
jgi:hypothetical protein